MSTKNIRVYLDAVTDEYSRKMKIAATDTKLVGSAAEKIQKPIRAIGVAFAAAGAASGLAIKGIISAGAEYQSSMNMVRAVTGGAGDDLTALGDIAKEVGATTKFSAGEAADGLYFLASAGFSAEEAIAALPGVTQLAAAAGMDLATASDIASNVLSGYGMQVGELGRVNDVLTVTFQGTNTNILQLGEALTYVGPVASAVGMEFEETAAALGLLGNAGIQGSMAGTTLRGILTALIDPSGEAADILERLGINAMDSTGQMRPLADIIDDIGRSAMTEAEAMTIFGQRAGPGLLALVQQGADALRTQTVAGLNSAGAAADVAAIQMEGVSGAFAEFRSAVEAVKIALFEAGLGDWFESVVRGATRAVQAFATLPDPIHKALAGMLAFVAVVGTLGGVLLAALAPMIATKLAVWGINKAIGKTVLLTPLALFRRGIYALKGALLEANIQIAMKTVGLGGMSKALAITKIATAGAVAGVKALGTALLSLALNPVTIAVAGLTAVLVAYKREQRLAQEAAEAWLDTWREEQDLETISGINAAVRDLNNELNDLSGLDINRLEGPIQFFKNLGESIMDTLRLLDEVPRKIQDNMGYTDWYHGTINPDTGEPTRFTETGYWQSVTDTTFGGTGGWFDQAAHEARVQGEVIRTELEALEDTARLFEAALNDLDPAIQGTVRSLGVDAVKATESYQFAMRSGWGETIAMEMGVQQLAASLGITAEQAVEAAKEIERFENRVQALEGVVSQFLDMNQAMTRSRDENRESAEAAAEAHNAAIDSQIEKLKDGDREAREALMGQKKSWEDFADDFPVTIGQLTGHLEDVNQEFRDWQEDIALIAERSGAGVAEKLALMGPEWAPIVALAVDATAEEIAALDAAMADNLDLHITAIELAIQFEILEEIVRRGGHRVGGEAAEGMVDSIANDLGVLPEMVQGVFEQIGVPVVTVDADIDPMLMEFLEAHGLADQIDVLLATATYDANIDLAERATRDAEQLGNKWDSSLYEADIDAARDKAVREFLAANGLADAWDRRRAEATADVALNRHSLNRIESDLGWLTRNRTVNISTRVTGGSTAGSGMFLNHDGGFAGTGPKRYHDGGWPGLRHDEVPSILQLGEFVLSRDMVAGLGGPRGVNALADWASKPQPAAPSVMWRGLGSGGGTSGPVQHVENQHIYNRADAGLVVDQLEFAMSSGRL